MFYLNKSQVERLGLGEKFQIHVGKNFASNNLQLGKTYDCGTWLDFLSMIILLNKFVKFKNLQT